MYGKMNTFRIARACGLLLIATAFADAGTISMWRDAIVTGNEIKLSDICHFSEMSREERDVCGAVTVAPAPVAGGSSIVTMDEVRRALNGSGLNLATIVLKGATSCDVVRPESLANGSNSGEHAETRAGSATSLAAQGGSTLREALEAFLGEELTVPGARISVQYGHVDEQVLALREPEYGFEFERTTGRRFGMVGLEVTILDAGQTVRRLPLMVNVSFVKPVVVAARAINMGATVSAADLRIVEMTFTEPRQAGVGSVAHAVGQRAKRFVAAGQVVKPQDLEPVPLVRRGQIVDVHSRVGGVAVVSAATALGSGTYGEAIELRSGDRSRERFMATITGPGQVSLDAAANGPNAELAMGGRN